MVPQILALKEVSLLYYMQRQLPLQDLVTLAMFFSRNRDPLTVSESDKLALLPMQRDG